MEERITRTYEFEIRAENDETNGDYLVGTPIVYNAMTNIGGMFNEIIERGALDNTDLTDVAFLVNHDTSKLPLARSRRNNANSSMQMMIDPNGMNIRVNLDTANNADARSLYSATKRGDIDGMSFAFMVDGEEWTELDSDMPTRHIRSIRKVMEVSAVTFPAYNQTTLEARDAEALDNAKAALEKVKTEQRVAELKENIRNKIMGGKKS